MRFKALAICRTGNGSLRKYPRKFPYPAKQLNGEIGKDREMIPKFKQDDLSWRVINANDQWSKKKN